MSHSLLIRPRRLRQHEGLRKLCRETQLSREDFILPLFIRHGEKQKLPIASMPGHFQLTLDKLSDEIKEITELKIPAVILFGIPAHKDAIGSESYASTGIINQAIHTIKELAPDLMVIADTCFCEYTSHGHCGVIHETAYGKDVANDPTLELLGKQAVAQAKAGADMIAPSGMMDGMVKAIRQALDENSFNHIPIMSYSVKYASSFYGPFREAAEGVPQFGDRRTYQMDPANALEALRECELDIAEGADILMVKPALPYLDIIHRVKTNYPHLPLAAYQVSGEYAMIKAASANGWLNEKQVMLESVTAIKRAGADMIVSYFSKDLAKIL